MATFIDTNVPVYAAGRQHPLKEPCRLLLLLAGEHAEAFVTDAEVFQELLHRYLSLRNWSLGRGVFHEFQLLMQGRIEAVQGVDVDAAANLADLYSGLEARDLIHLAVMNRVGATRIISADTGFDRVPGIERLDPARLDAWRGGLLADT